MIDSETKTPTREIVFSLNRRGEIVGVSLEIDAPRASGPRETGPYSDAEIAAMPPNSYFSPLLSKAIAESRDPERDIEAARSSLARIGRDPSPDDAIELMVSLAIVRASIAPFASVSSERAV